MKIREWVVKILFIEIACMIMYLGMQIVVSENGEIWFSNVFGDKTFTFQLAPLFLIGSSLIDSVMNNLVLIRIGSKKRYIHLILVGNLCWAILFLSVWISMVIVVISIKVYEKIDFSLVYFGNVYIHYFCALILLSVTTMVIGSFRSVLVKNNRYIISLCVLILETLVLAPELRANTSFRNSILFTCAFDESLFGIVKMMIAIVLSIYYLLKLSINMDTL